MTRSCIFSAVAWAWLALAASVFPVRAELKPEDLYAAVLPSVVTLDVENTVGRHFVGTAFLAVGDGLAITAWHVVHDARRVEASYADGQRVKVVGLVDRNEQLDLALIKLAGAPRPKIPLDSAPPRIGSRIYLLGAPRGFDFSISEGLISQVRTLDGVRYYQLSCPISPGDSGGPVLNDRGDVIAVVSWRKADAENVGFAIPAAAVANMHAALPPTAWPAACSVVNRPDPQPLVRAESAIPTPGSSGNVGELQKYLSSLAGEHVGITIQARGAERHFDIELPREAEGASALKR
jgi:S1-C subfamily serine protease